MSKKSFLVYLLHFLLISQTRATYIYCDKAEILPVFPTNLVLELL